MSEHALLSPSSSDRWSICTPSARTEERIPNVTSEWADEGTLAHEYGSTGLLSFLRRISISDAKVKQAGILLTAEQRGYKTKDIQYYMQQYIDFCVDIIAKNGKRGITFVEEKFDLSRYVPESFGTSDFSSATPGRLTIVDYKHGEGVQVSAEDNSQLKLYALGMLEVAEMLYPIHTIDMYIFQPRLNNISKCTVKITDLKQWAAEVIVPKAKIAFAGKGDYVAGEHCRFCRAKSRCKALASYHSELAKYDFQPPDLLTNADIGKILTKAETFTNWINAVKAYALDQARHGKKIPGFKVVAGKSNRVWIDEKLTLDYLLDCGYDKNEVMETGLKSITKLQDMLGTGEFHKILGEYVLKPTGAPTLVPLSDSRPALNSAEDAANDFKHIKI